MKIKIRTVKKSVAPKKEVQLSATFSKKALATKPKEHSKEEFVKCPFCKTQNAALITYPQFVVKCLHCGSMGPIIHHDKETELNAGGRLFRTAEEAIKAWNDYKPKK